MSGEASAYLRLIYRKYLARRRPALDTWYFDAGVSSAALTELAALGFVYKILGTERGYAWRLSEAGALQAKSLLLSKE